MTFGGRKSEVLRFPPSDFHGEAFDVDVNSDCLCGRCVHCNAWDWQLVGRDEVKDNPKARHRGAGASVCLNDIK